MNTLAFLAPFIVYYGGWFLLAAIVFTLALALFGERGFVLCLLAAAVVACCTSCSIEPVVVYSEDKGFDVAWLGGSLLTKSKGMERRIVRADGTVLESKTAERNETAVPVTGAMVGMGETLLNKAPSVVESLKQ